MSKPSIHCVAYHPDGRPAWWTMTWANGGVWHARTWHELWAELESLLARGERERQRA